VDFSKVLYLTDTGRRWNGEKVSIRDKVNKRADIPLGTKGERQQVQGFKRTSEIIQAVNKGALPDQIMFTFHPQRWTGNSYLWLKEFVVQNVKNQVKKAIIRFS